MKFSEFFDPWSTEHIRAFDVACKTGMWPIGFIPDGMEMGSFWFVTAITAISEAYCDVVLGRKNLIVVPPQDGGEPAAERPWTRSEESVPKNHQQCNVRNWDKPMYFTVPADGPLYWSNEPDGPMIAWYRGTEWRPVEK